MIRLTDSSSAIIIVDDLEACFEIANEVAPEHLELLLENAEQYIDKIENAGSIFVGEYTPEPVGDYFAGTNHTIPTSGKAKFYSPLSSYDFMKRTSVISYSKEALENIKDKVITFAEGRTDLIYITCIPWVSFTNLSHTISFNKDDAVPRLAWGKYFEEGDKILIPFSVQAHHSFVDGIHMGLYFDALQDYLDTF